MWLSSLLTLLRRNWQLVAGLLLALLSLAFGYWAGEKHVQDRWDEQRRDDQLNALAISNDLEQKLTEQRRINAELSEQVANEVKTVPIYRDCKLPDNGRVLINRARKDSRSR